MSENERLKAAALNLRGVMADIEVIEKKLEELNDERKRLEREVLPDLFAEAGIKALQLADGSRITLSTLAEGSLPKGATVVCVLTGHGLKDPEWAIAGAAHPVTVPADPAAVAAELGL